MGLFTKNTSDFPWVHLTTNSDLKEILSQQKAVIFKHSTRCSISSMALNQFEQAVKNDHYTFYFLDLLNYREISNLIAEQTGVIHQSPQAIVLDHGKVQYDASHGQIDHDFINSL